METKEDFLNAIQEVKSKLFEVEMIFLKRLTREQLSELFDMLFEENSTIISAMTEATTDSKTVKNISAYYTALRSRILKFENAAFETVSFS